MNFELKNYKQLLANENYIKRINVSPNNEELTLLSPNPVVNNVKTTSFNNNLDNVIKSLNDNPILNYSHDKEIKIVFENFTLFNKIIQKIPYLNKKDTTDPGDAFYNYQTQNVFIQENLLKRSTPDSFSAVLFQKVNIKDYLNIVVLHEIGHAIHHQYYLNNNKHLSTNDNLSNFINKTVDFHLYHNPQSFDSLANTRSLPYANFNAVRENFADTFACLAATQIYPKKEAENIIQALYESRQFANHNRMEEYHTQGSITTILNDLKNNKLNFNSFTDLYTYQSNLIKSTISTLLDTQLTNKNKNQFDDGLNNYYLGTLNQALKLGKSNATDVLKELNIQNITQVSSIKNMDNFFKQGVNAEIQFEQSHASLEGSNLKDKINQLRDTNVSTNTSLSLKDKIQVNRLQNQPQPTSTSMTMKYQK
jgi:hypothetical protein